MTARRVGTQFRRFVSVGGLGFLLDLGVFQGLVWLGLEPIPARLVSASMAITLTWILNRHLVFYTSSQIGRGAEYVRYVVVQGVGLSINLGVFLLLISSSELAGRVPVLALIGGAAAAIVFNYLGARWWAFRPHADRR